MGDGRLSLDSQPDQNFDILLIDVFNGDAIPVHVLTKEAVETYLRHLKKDGLILIHTSNKYIDLSLITKNLATEFDFTNINFSTEDDGKYMTKSTYSVLSKDNWIVDKLNSMDFKKEYPQTSYIVESPNKEVNKNFLWTDDYSNLFSILKLK